MRYEFIRCVCAIVVVAGLSCAVSEESQVEAGLTPSPDVLAQSETPTSAVTVAKAALPEFSFPVGEILVYSVHWGFLYVGEVRIWNELVEEEGRTLLAIRVRVTTESILEKLFPVDDFIESIVEPQTLLPLRFTRRLSEGRYRLHEVTTFDHTALSAHWKHLLRENSEEVFPIEADTRDMISFMYHMRGYDWQPDSELFGRVMANEKLYDLVAQIRQYEEIKLPKYGSVRSLLIEPEAKFKGAFINAGRLRVWISDDKRCLCTMATAKVPVGTVRVMLRRVEGPGQDRWLTQTAAKSEEGESDE
ncbi:MAG: DUF3108 domain-containing protein [Kiritimatiellia bacterium]|jgi:hypothetical protein